MARDYTGRQTSDKKTLDLASKVSLLVLGIIFLLAAIITPLVVFMSRTSHGTVSYGDFIYQYNIENGNVYYDIKKYIGQGTENVIIPSEYNGAPVVGILENAFNGNSSNIHRNIKKITFDTSGYGGISRIDEGAFVGLASLTEFTLPSQIEIIAEGAFEDCVISGDFVVSDLGSFFENTNGIIGDYVSISTGAFDNCSVGGKLIVENATGGIVPGEVLNAFGGLNATEVELSPNVNIFNLGTSSFASFRALETLTIYTCANEVGSNYYTADNFDMANCTNLKNLNVLFGSEEKVDYHLTQKFVQSPLENVYFGEGVTELGAKTFDDFDNLKQITVNNNVVTNSQGEIVEIKGFAVDRNIMPDDDYTTKGIKIYFENEDQGILNNLKINYDRTLVPNPSNSGHSSIITQEFMSIFTKDKIRTLTIGADITGLYNQSLVGLFGGSLPEGEGFGLNFEVRGDGDISAMRTVSQSLFSTIPSENVRIVRNVDVTGPRTAGGDNSVIYTEFNTADGTYRNRKSYNGNLDWGDSVYNITFDLNMSNENFDGFSPSLSITNIPNVENNDYITMPIDNNNAGNEYALVGFIQNGNGSGGGSGTTYRVSQLNDYGQLLFRASEWNVETDEDERTRLVTIYCMWEKKVYHNVTYVPQFSDTTISLSQIHPEYYTYFISYTEGRVAENSTYGSGAIILNEEQNSEFVGGMPEIYQSGFMFNGWNTQSDGSGQDVGVDTVCTGELTLYGQWEEISYNIIYHATTQDFTSASQATYTKTLAYNDAMIMLTGTNIASVYHVDGFYITGYNFIGWTTSETLTGASLDFELDSIFDEWGESSNKLTSDLLFNLFGEEYYFDQNVINFESPMFNARDVHLYGMYSEAEYTLDYVLGDLSNPADFESQTLLYGGEITLERGLQIERTGYTFTGYGVRRSDGSVTGALFNLVNNGEENVVPVLSTELLVAKYGLANAGELKYEHCCDQPIEIVAIWSANVVEVTFNANGGSGQEQISYAYDQAAPLSDGTAFTRAGYSLIGWAINSTLTTPTFNLYTDGNITTVTGQQLLKARFNLSQDQDLTFEQGLTNALTLYAVWEQHIYNLSVDFGDGTAPYEFGEVTFGGSYGAISQDEINSHTNPGFVFAGIYSEANGGGTQIWTATGEPAQDTFNASFASSGDQTVYAFWTLTNYSLNFNVNTKIGGDDISTQALGNTMSILLNQNPFSSGDAIELEDSLTLTFTPAQGFVFSGLYAITGGSSLDNLGAQDVVSELISEPYNIDITAQFLHDYLYNNSVNLVALFIAKEFNVEFVLENTDNVVTDWGTLGNPGYSYLYNEEGNPDSGIRGITSTVVFSKPFSYVKYLSGGEVVYGEQPWPSITLSNAYFNNWIIKIGSAEQIINAESEVLANILTNIDELEHGATITLYARCSNYEAYNITITTPSDYPDAYSGYSITQDFAEGGSSTTNGSATEIVGVRRGAIVTLTLSVNAGYIITDATSDDCHIDDFKLDSTKQNVTLQLVMPTNNVEINLFARKISGTVSFKVYHYAENLDGSYSQLSPILTEDKEFVFDENTTDFTVAVADYVLTDATYNGDGGMFEFDYASTSFGDAGVIGIKGKVEISTDGTSEIHIFYKRMIHSLTINVLRNDQAAGGIVTNLSANPPLTSLDGGRTFASANIKYGQSVAISQVDIVVGYKFVNYTLESGNITFAAKDLTQTLTMGTQDSILNLNITESMLTLTLNANGAEFNELDTGEWQVSTDPGSGSQIATKQVAYGSTLNFLPTGNEIVKTGFTFVGWFTNADGGGTQYTSSSTMPSTALTLYAYFKATEYRVTINKTDASHFSNISAKGGRIDGTQSYLTVTYGAQVTLNITMADGCYVDSATFNPSLGVSGLTKTKNVTITFTYTLVRDSTLNLASVMVTYNITFLSNGGILNGTNSNIDLPGLAYNNTQTISGTITSAQYNFHILSGWQVSYNGSDGDFEDYTSDNLPKPNLNESDLSLSNNAHIYLKAIWRTHSYTLEFTLPSGLSENVATLSASSTTIKYGNQYTLRDLVILNLIGANNAAFTMQGWKTYVNGELKEGAYIDEVDFVSGNSNANSTVSLNLTESDPWFASLGNIADGDTITLEADIIVTTVDITLNMIFMGTDGNYENSQTAGTLTINYTANVGITLQNLINEYIESQGNNTFVINRTSGGSETVSFAGFTLDTSETGGLNTVIGYQDGVQEQNYTIYFARNSYTFVITLLTDKYTYSPIVIDRQNGQYVTNSSGGYFPLTYNGDLFTDTFVIYYNDTATINALTRTGFTFAGITLNGRTINNSSSGYTFTVNENFLNSYLSNNVINCVLVWDMIEATVRFDVLDGTFNDASADPNATSLSVLQSEYGFVRVTTNLYYSETLDLYYHYGSSSNDRYFYRVVPQGSPLAGLTTNSGDYFLPTPFKDYEGNFLGWYNGYTEVQIPVDPDGAITDPNNVYNPQSYIPQDDFLDPEYILSQIQDGTLQGSEISSAHLSKGTGDTGATTGYSTAGQGNRLNTVSLQDYEFISFETRGAVTGELEVSMSWAAQTSPSQIDGVAGAYYYNGALTNPFALSASGSLYIYNIDTGELVTSENFDYTLAGDLYWQNLGYSTNQSNICITGSDYDRTIDIEIPSAGRYMVFLEAYGTGFYQGTSVGVSFPTGTEPTYDYEDYNQGNGNAYGYGSIINGDTTLYAIYKNGRVTFNANPNNSLTLNNFQSNVDFNESDYTFVKPVMNGQAIGSLPTVSASGYVFEGWFSEPDGGFEITSSTNAQYGNMNVYAHWTQAVTVEFWAEGTGTVSGQSNAIAVSDIIIDESLSVALDYNGGYVTLPSSLDLPGRLGFRAYSFKLKSVSGSGEQVLKSSSLESSSRVYLTPNNLSEYIEDGVLKIWLTWQTNNNFATVTFRRPTSTGAFTNHQTFTVNSGDSLEFASTYSNVQTAITYPQALDIEGLTNGNYAYASSQNIWVTSNTYCFSVSDLVMSTTTAFTQSTAVNGNTTVYANVTPNYTINFIANTSGSDNSVVYTVSNVVAGQSITLPTNLTNSGYRLVGWSGTRQNAVSGATVPSTLADIIQQADYDEIYTSWQIDESVLSAIASSQGSHTINVYAVWGKLYNLHFSTENGHISGDTEIYGVCHGDNGFEAPRAYWSVGSYRYDWVYSRATNVLLSSVNASYVESDNLSINIEARWVVYFTVNYYIYNESLEYELYETVTYDQGTYHIIRNGLSHTCPGNDPFFNDVRASCVGWATDPSGGAIEYNFGSSITNRNLDLYGMYMNDPRVSFVYSVGGVSTSHAIRFAKYGSSLNASDGYGASYGMPSDPEIEGYTFLGWTTRINGQTPNFTGNETLTANTSVYAVLEINTYRVTIAESGTTSVFACDSSVASGSTINHGGSITLDLTVFGYANRVDISVSGTYGDLSHEQVYTSTNVVISNIQSNVTITIRGVEDINFTYTVVYSPSLPPANVAMRGTVAGANGTSTTVNLDGGSEATFRAKYLDSYAYFNLSGIDVGSGSNFYTISGNFSISYSNGTGTVEVAVTSSTPNFVVRLSNGEYRNYTTLSAAYAAAGTSKTIYAYESSSENINIGNGSISINAASNNLSFGNFTLSNNGRISISGNYAEVSATVSISGNTTISITGASRVNISTSGSPGQGTILTINGPASTIVSISSGWTHSSGSNWVYSGY